MSAGPLEEYTGTSGVADEGGDSLTADLNVYYAVRCILASLPGHSCDLQALDLTSSWKTVRRLRLDPHIVGPRPAYGPWCGLLLQRSCPSQVCTRLDMALIDEYSSCGVPVVLLGLQFGIQSYRQRLHRGHVQLWSHESLGSAQRGKY